MSPCTNKNLWKLIISLMTIQLRVWWWSQKPQQWAKRFLQPFHRWDIKWRKVKVQKSEENQSTLELHQKDSTTAVRFFLLCVEWRPLKRWGHNQLMKKALPMEMFTKIRTFNSWRRGGRPNNKYNKITQLPWIKPTAWRTWIRIQAALASNGLSSRLLLMATITRWILTIQLLIFRALRTDQWKWQQVNSNQLEMPYKFPALNSRRKRPLRPHLKVKWAGQWYWKTPVWRGENLLRWKKGWPWRTKDKLNLMTLSWCRNWERELSVMCILPRRRQSVLSASSKRCPKNESKLESCSSMSFER